MSVEIYKCNACGGEMAFDPKTGELTCAYCGAEKAVNKTRTMEKHALATYETRLKGVDQAGQGDEAQAKSTLECRSCGAVIELSPLQTATTCPYCNGNIVLAEKAVSQIDPDGLRPFAMDPRAVGELFQKWLQGKWLAPNALKTLYQSGKVLGVYLPYWTFDVDADCRYTAEGGVNREVRYQENGEERVRIETDWYPISGTLFNRFENRLMRATTTLPEHLIRSLGGFRLTETVVYDSGYLAGYGSELFNVPMPTAYREAQLEMRGDLTDMVVEQERSRYDQVRGVSLDVDWTEEYYRMLMLPVYATSYSFNGQVYRVLINGETGHIVGEYPKSVVKIVLLVLAILVVVALFYYMSQGN